MPPVFPSAPPSTPSITPSAPPAAPSTLPRSNLVTFTSPSGGVGLSTLMAMCGLTLGKRGISVALLDVDMSGGGLGVLLGIEHDPGLTLQDLNAPLGHIEGAALNHELPQWEGMRILANAPWSGEPPDWWEIQAAVRALCEANDLVLADAGRGSALAHVPDLAVARQVVAVELSALGMTRTKSHIAMLERLGNAAVSDGRDAANDDIGASGLLDREPPIVIGVEPRGLTKRAAASTVALREAIARFGDEALGPMRGDPSLCADVMNGLGIKAVPKSCGPVIEALTDGLADPSPPVRERRRRGAKRARRRR